MKSQKHLLWIFSVLTVAGVLSSCAGSGGGGGGAATTAVTPGACGSGLVNSQYGCIPQGNCSVGSGMYQNQCVLVNNVAGACAIGSVQTAQGCLPQGSCPIGTAFNGSSCILVQNAGLPGTLGYQNGYYPNTYNNGYYGGGYGAGYYYQPRPYYWY